MASGNTLAVLLPLGGQPPNSAYAQFDTRNQHPVIAFDASSVEAMVWTAVLPRQYGGSGITAYLHWVSTATTGDCVWETSFELIGTSQDIDSDGFATANTATTTTNATAGIPAVTSIAHTDGAQIDSIAVGNAFRFKVSRNATSGSDTLAVDAQLLAIELKET